jgi:hypothetical protein
MKDDWIDYVAAYLPKLPSEDAVFSLMEMEPEALPLLYDAFDRSSDPEFRAALLKVIRNYHSNESLQILERALNDSTRRLERSHQRLLSLGGDEALARLRRTLSNVAGNKREYICGSFGRMEVTRGGLAKQSAVQKCPGRGTGSSR